MAGTPPITDERWAKDLVQFVRDRAHQLDDELIFQDDQCSKLTIKARNCSKSVSLIFDTAERAERFKHRFDKEPWTQLDPEHPTTVYTLRCRKDAPFSQRFKMRLVGSLWERVDTYLKEHVGAAHGWRLGVSTKSGKDQHASFFVSPPGDQRIHALYEVSSPVGGSCRLTGKFGPDGLSFRNAQGQVLTAAVLTGIMTEVQNLQTSLA